MAVKTRSDLFEHFAKTKRTAMTAHTRALNAERSLVALYEEQAKVRKRIHAAKQEYHQWLDRAAFAQQKAQAYALVGFMCGWRDDAR